MEAGGEKCAQFADCISLKRIERQVQRMTVGKTATTGSHGRESQSARAKSFWTAQWFSNEHVLSTSMHQTGAGCKSPKFEPLKSPKHNKQFPDCVSLKQSPARRTGTERKLPELYLHHRLQHVGRHPRRLQCTSGAVLSAGPVPEPASHTQSPCYEDSP